MRSDLLTGSKWLGAVLLSSLLGNSFAQITENFSDINTLTASGWVRTNNSSPLGLTGWSQGSTEVFTSHNGPANSFISANFNNTTGATGTISNWLISPEQTLNNGDVITFYTRRPNGTEYADRLQLRLSTAGASTNVGTGATDVGDFTTLLTEVNPALTLGVYPDNWTKYQVVISGLSGPTQGRVAFRYFVTQAGPSGANSNYIGIDNFSYTACAAPVITPSGSTTICEGDSVILNTASYMSTPVNSEITVTITSDYDYMDEVVWTIKDNSGTTIAQSPPTNGYQEPATYKYKFLSANAPYTFDINTQGLYGDNYADYEIRCNGNIILSGTILEDAAFSQSNLACVGSLPASVTYAWTPPNGLSSASDQNPVASPTSDETYSLLATDAGSGCSKTQTVDITVTPAPAAPTITASGPTTFCDGDSVTLTSSEATGNVWSGSETTPSVTVYDGGSYTVYFVDGNGCPSLTSTPTVVTVNDIPAAPGIGSNSPVCEGDDINLTANTVSGATYVWTGPNSFSSSDENPTVAQAEADDAGTYSAYIIVNGCSSATATTDVVISSDPTASFTTANTGPVFDFTNTSQDETSVTWDFGDGSPTSNLDSPSHTYTANGTYTVTLTATNSCGTSTSTQDVTVFGIGIKESDILGNVSVYPNPAENGVNVSISMKQAGDVSFKVYDMQGKLLANRFVGNVSGQYTHWLDISSLAAGTYQLSLETADGKVVRQIVKK